jgi:hypothetical protein
VSGTSRETKQGGIFSEALLIRAPFTDVWNLEMESSGRLFKKAIEVMHTHAVARNCVVARVWLQLWV